RSRRGGSSGCKSDCGRVTRRWPSSTPQRRSRGWLGQDSWSWRGPCIAFGTLCYGERSRPRRPRVGSARSPKRCSGSSAGEQGGGGDELQRWARHASAVGAHLPAAQGYLRLAAAARGRFQDVEAEQFFTLALSHTGETELRLREEALAGRGRVRGRGQRYHE